MDDFKIFICYRHKNISIADDLKQSAVFNFYKSKFPNDRNRFRLEVEPNNTKAIEFYKKIGFIIDPYIGMSIN